MSFVHSRVAILVFLLLITGCVGPVKMLPTLAPDTVVADNQGIVVARVINASGYGLPFNQLTITPEKLHESREIKLERLLALPSRMRGTTVFSSPVKAGTYALSSIRAFHSNGSYWYNRFVSTNASFGVFTVSPGAITDLGTLIYYPKSQDDKYINMLLRVPGSEQGEVLSKYFPFFNSGDKPFLAWHDDARDDERLSDYASVAQNPVAYSTRYLAPDNTLYFLAKLGVILIRNADGRWSMDAVDTNLELTTIAQNERGDLIVGGGEGRLFWKPEAGEWVDISLNTNYNIEKVLFVNQDTVDVIATETNKLSIFRAHTGSQPLEWTELNHYTSIAGWHSIPEPEPKKKSSATKKPIPKIMMGVTLLDSGDETLITVKEMSPHSDPVFNQASSKTYRYNPADWHVEPLDKKPDISTIIDAGKIKLGIRFASFWSWDGKTDYLRYVPDTNSWVEIATSVKKCRNGSYIRGKLCPPPVVSEANADKKAKKKKATKSTVERSMSESFYFRSTPVFSSEMDGIAVVTFTDFNAWSGKRTTRIKLLTTDDGGQSWLPSDNKLPHDYCSAFVPEVTDRLLVSCNGSSGDFYESFDKGKTWQHVRQHENF